MLNENTYLIEKLQHDLTQDFEQWLSFQDLLEEEQNEICENIASNEYENNDYYDLAGDEFIYEDASEKMGYIREASWQDDEKNLLYRLSYSQGDYTYLIGNYNLHDLLKCKLYSNMEALEKNNKEYWIKEVLKPKLKGKYNRATKHFKRDITKTYYLN